MELSFLLAEQITVQFLMLIIGFVLIRLKIFKASDATIISRLLLFVILPCLIINSFRLDFSETVTSKLIFTIAVSLASNILLILLAYTAAKVFHLDKIETLTIAYPNCGNLIMPLILATLGSQWVIFACIYTIIQSLLMFTHARSVMRGTKGFNLKEIFINANNISAFIGLIIMIFHIPLPRILDKTITSFAGMTAPCSMLVIGMIVGQANLKGIFARGRNYFICFLRLIALPMILLTLIKITGIAYIFDDAKQILMTTVMCASSSAATTITQFAQAYNNNSYEASSFNIMSVLFLIVTLPLIIAFYQMWI